MPPLYFEDLPQNVPLEAGPFTVNAEQLARFVDLTGEAYPIHTADSFAARTIVGRRIPPGRLVLAVALTRLREAHGDLAVLELRDTHHDYLRVVHLDEPLRVRARITVLEPLDEARGLVRTVVQILDANGKVVSVGRRAEVVRRRPAA